MHKFLIHRHTKSMLEAPIMRQYGQDTNNLNSELGAGNQLGSSYDALRHNMLMQGRDYSLGQAENQARQLSFQGFDQGFKNQLLGLAGLGDYQTNLQNRLFQPAGMAAQFQSGVSGANQNAMTQQQNNQSNLLNGFNGLLGAFKGNTTANQGIGGIGGYPLRPVDLSGSMR